MFYNTVAGMFILVFIYTFFRLHQLEYRIDTRTKTSGNSNTVKPAETPRGGDKPNYHYGVIEPENNLFGMIISGVDKNFTNNYKVYNELQREFFLHQEYGGDDLDKINDLLIEQYGCPLLITVEKCDINNDSQLDVVAVSMKVQRV